MKLPYLIILFFAPAFAISTAAAQANASINILVNGGVVGVGQPGALEVSVGNTGPTSSIGIYKLIVDIAVPATVTIDAVQTQLPEGWTVLYNDPTEIILSNATDIIPVNTSRVFSISFTGGASVAAAQTIAGGLSFSTGVAPGTDAGGLPGNNTGDDNSTTTVQVTNPTPVTLIDFNASLISCQPVLNWITESEVNSDRFEVERANQNSSNWVSLGVAAARGNGSAKIKYSFIDNSVAVSSEKVLYRLKIIDKDGHYKYSNVIPVLINCKTAQVSVYPSPVQNGTLYVSLTGSNANTEAALLSLSGQVILKTHLNNGTNSLNVSKVTNGEYILRVTGISGINKKVKVLIQH